MKTVLLIVLIISHLSILRSANECFDTIKAMATDDKCYCSRAELKKEKAKAANNAQAFADSLKGIKCKVVDFSCGYTRSWITEVFEGTNSDIQFKENKYDNGFIGTNGAGYENVTGDQLVKIFKDKKDSSNRIVYHMRMTGTQDHVWAIEQSPAANGYRIYQSYNDGYSLNAWLASDITSSFDKGDIIEPNKLKAKVGGAVKKLTNGAASLEDLSKLPVNLIPLKPYLEWVRDYKKEAVIANFKKAWEEYGKGKLLLWKEFEKYLSNLKKFADYFAANDTTTNPFSKEIYDLWIAMFGSPNPIYWPNLPNNILSSMLLPGKKFRFEILTAMLPEKTACVENAKFFRIDKNGTNLSFLIYAIVVLILVFFA